MDELEINEQNISKINTAGLQNLRRDELWKDANKHSRNGEYKKWNEDLDALWRELSGSTKKESAEEKEWNSLCEEFSKVYSPVQKVGFEQLQDGDYAKLLKQKAVLVQKEIFLRRLEDSQGKGAAYKDASDDYMDN